MPVLGVGGGFLLCAWPRGSMRWTRASRSFCSDRNRGAPGAAGWVGPRESVHAAITRPLPTASGNHPRMGASSTDRGRYLDRYIRVTAITRSNDDKRYLGPVPLQGFGLQR